jgi:hypothetical protein
MRKNSKMSGSEIPRFTGSPFDSAPIISLNTVEEAWDETLHGRYKLKTTESANSQGKTASECETSGLSQ